jgi:predicted transposase YbfD/YdcC
MLGNVPVKATSRTTGNRAIANLELTKAESGLSSQQRRAIRMSAELRERIASCFAELQDPRQPINQTHLFIDLLVISICAIVCGADDWEAVADYAAAKEEWLAGFLTLPGGPPAHDTFWRVFRHLDAEQFQRCFLQWIASTIALKPGQVIALDGKQLRRSHDQREGHAPIHMLSAWASENQLVLGQLRVDEKTNEITALPELLAALDVRGCIVTVDALGCQTEVAQTVIDRGGDYLFALKGNHPLLHADSELLFSDLAAAGINLTPACIARDVNKDHGRIEIRQAWVVHDPDTLRALQGSEKWPQLAAIVKLEAERIIGDIHERNTRYYLASFPIQAHQAITMTRHHWHVENCLHWVLDMAFREDECRIRKDHGPHNFAILRHIALNLLKQEKSSKLGIKNKRLKAGWDDNYCLRVLQPLFS